MYVSQVYSRQLLFDKLLEPSTQIKLTCNRIGWRMHEYYHRPAIRCWYT